MKHRPVLAYAIFVVTMLGATACGSHLPVPQDAARLQPGTGYALRAAGTLNDWSTAGYDLARTGYNPNEQTIGVGSFATLHQTWSISVGGQIGEPVFAAGLLIKKVPTNVLYVPLAGGKITARNGDTGSLIWSKSFPLSSYNCGLHQSQFGVAGAPVIDRKSHRLYVADGINQVHALDLTTGAEAPGWPIAIAAYTHDDFVFGALTYNPANKILYAETSSTCDISPWYGRIAAIDTVHATILNTFFPTQGTSGGGIWGFGGASVDQATNDVFVAVGNADTTNGALQNAYYAEQVVELSPDLSTVLGNNFPNISGIGDDDLDFGATPMLFQPPGCGPLVAAINKDGSLYLYNRAAISSGPVQSIQMSIATDNADFVGMPAYDPVTNYLYVEQPATFGIYKPGVAAFSIASDCTLNPTPVWAASFGEDGALTDDDTLRSPISLANGVLYVSDYGTHAAYAFDAQSGAQLWTLALPGPGAVGPIAVDGRLYIGSMGSKMTAFVP